MLRIYLLGKPRFQIDDAPMPYSARPKVVPLLAYLLVHRQGPISRESVAHALWPDGTEADARSNLRRHIQYLQQLLPPPQEPHSWLLVTPTTIAWNAAANFSLDVADFERLIDTGRLGDAAALYGGDLLEESEEEFLAVQRERLRSAYIGCLCDLIAEKRGRRDFASAITSAKSLLARDPWREDVLRQLMTIRHEAGDRAGAIADYERFSVELSKDLDVTPMPETVALYKAIVDDGPLPGIVAAEAPHADVRRARAQQELLPFVGRDIELQFLRTRWNRAASGDGGLVLVGGEAGIGKTRLVRELATSCASGGGQAFSGATTFPENTPYQALLAMMRSAAPLAASLKINPIWLAALSTLIPELRTIVPSLPDLSVVDPQRERTRLFEACAAFVESLGERRPACFIIEDVHWAGAGTIALLEYIARRLRKSRVMFVATYREDEVGRGHPLREMRRSLENEGMVDHLALVRLSPEAVAAVIENNAALPAQEALDIGRRLHDQSEGNPFFLDEIVHDLIETGTITIDSGRWRFGAMQERMPTGVIHAIEQRFARLSDRARTVAETAAVVGRGFGVELLIETTGWPEGALVEALDELVDRRLVGERGGHTRFDYAFNHHLIQVAVYAGIDEATRARRHRRIAHVLEELYPDASFEIAGELALHWHRGLELERAADKYVLAARRTASLYANDEALAHLDLALELTQRPVVRLEALLMKERLVDMRGDRAEQARILEQARALVDELADDDKRRELLAREAALANVTSDREREAAVIAQLKGLADLLASPRWQAMALEAQARMLRTTGDFDGAREAFERLAALTKASGDRGTHWTAQLARADSFIYQGRLPEARAVLDDLRDSLDPDSNRGALIRTLMAFARAALVQQDYAAMYEFAEAALASSTAIGDREGEALALHTMANGMVYVFRIAEARRTYEWAAEIYEQIGHRVGSASVNVDMGLFHTEIGLLDRALLYYTRADEIATAIDFRWVLCVVEVNRGYCLRLCGEYGRAKTCASLAVERARTLGSVHLESAALGTLGGAERELGEIDAAIEHFRLGVELRRPAGATPRLGDNLCGLALAYLGKGDVAAARAAADEMLELYVANPKLAPQPTEWLWTAVQVCRALGEEDGAKRLLRQAASVMQARAASIDDDETRDAFLSLSFNRDVAAADVEGRA